MSETANPLRWAEVLLRLFLARRGRNRVGRSDRGVREEHPIPRVAGGARTSGSRGRSPVSPGARRGAWGLLVCVSMTARGVWDTFAPPLDGNWGPRSAFTTYWVIALFVFAGAWVARRTGRALSGPLAALATHIIGILIGVPFRIALFVIAIQPDPKRLELFYATGGWGEEWGIPLMLVPVVLVLGTLGGVVGKFFGQAPRRPAVS